MTYNTKLFAPPICVCMLALLVSILVLVIVTSSTTEDGALPTITPGGHGRRDMKPQSPARPAFLIRRFRVSSYCPCKLCCGRWASLPMHKRTTASGESLQALIRAGERFVAADQGIPFGTMVWVPGYGDGWVPVLDRGGKIRGDRLDVFYQTHQQAMAFGVKYVSVKIWRLP